MSSKVEQLHSEADSLAAKFQKGGQRSHIDEAIVLDREALDLCPPGHPKRAFSLNQLSSRLYDRYHRFGRMTDVDEAIVLSREALELSPSGHPIRLVSLKFLSAHLLTRYKQLGESTDLDEAIFLSRDALALCPPGHRDRLMYLNNVANGLSTRHDRFGGMEDLDEAVVLSRDTLALSPLGHPLRSISLNNLAKYLSTRYQRLGKMENLDEAIILSRDALALRPPGHPDRSMSLNNIASYLHTRYLLLGKREDLNEAIVLGRDALALRPPGHPLRSMSAINVAKYLSTRYEQLGEIEDLDKSIIIGRDALALQSPGHSLRSMALNNVARYLSIRYRQLGGTEDLNEAIVLGKEALALCPPGHPGRSKSLNNVANYLSIRYRRLWEMKDINEAIVLSGEALLLCPQGHPRHSASLNDLANYVFTRYMRVREMEDLNDVIVLSRYTLSLCPPGHAVRSMSLNNLGMYLFTRYLRLKGMEDLDEAIALNRDVLALRPSGHPDWSQSLGNLARCLRTRFAQSNQLKDKEELFSLYTQIANMPQTPTSADLSASRAWIDVAEDLQHPTILLAYETSLQLLVRHLAALPSLPQHIDVLRGLTSSLAVDALSACLRCHSPTRAIEFLEQGRGVFWSQLTRLNAPLDEVKASGSSGETLVEKFAELTSLIREALDSPGADQHDRVCHLNIELQKVVTAIRELPGVSHFLLPSLFADLQQAASKGPVIIVNASKYGCDALIVLLDRDPVHVPLRITKAEVGKLSSDLRTWTFRAKMMSVAKHLVVILRQLWDKVVSPIVNFLQTILPSQSRIWWCPTAEFSLLPLHAAGSYRMGQQRLADLYISSYTSTLTALIRARRNEPSNSSSQEQRFIGIGQANASGETELHSVGAELVNIGRRVDGLATFRCVEGSDSCITRVVEELHQNQWAHLACHGIPNRRQPFKSAFALHDGRFTIERIMRCELLDAQFAYLSACHTTVGDEDCPDEMIHLASAMQFAGFRSVIGTMWAVDDEQAQKITSVFYDKMVSEGSGRLDHTRAAFALHNTMKDLEGRISFDQLILYVHLGA